MNGLSSANDVLYDAFSDKTICGTEGCPEILCIRDRASYCKRCINRKKLLAYQKKYPQCAASDTCTRIPRRMSLCYIHLAERKKQMEARTASCIPSRIYKIPLPPLPKKRTAVSCDEVLLGNGKKRKLDAPPPPPPTPPLLSCDLVSSSRLRHHHQQFIKHNPSEWETSSETDRCNSDSETCSSDASTYSNKRQRSSVCNAAIIQDCPEWKPTWGGPQVHAFRFIPYPNPMT